METAKRLLWLMLVLSSFSVQAVSVINDINYQGNQVTQESVLNREIYIKPGDVLDNALIEKSRQAIMDLGLFKSVQFYLEENYPRDNVNDVVKQVDVFFIVEEKFYILLFPKLKINDSDIYYGIQLKWDNFLGLNHQTRIQAEDRGSTNGVDENRYLFRYFYPNVNNSSYNLNFELKTENDVDEVEGLVDRQDDSYKVGVSRWLNKTGRNRGWFAGGSTSYQKRLNEDLVVEANSENIDAIILGVDMGYKNINNFEYNRGGKAYGYRLDWSHESIGSDAAFTKHLFYYRSYYQVENQPYSNINVQMKFGHSNNKILGEYAFSLGSSSDLRGYENNRFSGNTLLLTNFEYMFPAVNYPSFRYVTFVDVGNTYDELSDIFHNVLNVGAGVGLRWKIRAFVKLDLRADVGYGFTDDDYKFSFGTRHAF